MDILVRLQANVSIDEYSLVMDPFDECQMFHQGPAPMGITSTGQQEATVFSRFQHATGRSDGNHVLEVVSVAVVAVQCAFLARDGHGECPPGDAIEDHVSQVFRPIWGMSLAMTRETLSLSTAAMA